jgi:outer membrane protein assembly factor BamB
MHRPLQGIMVIWGLLAGACVSAQTQPLEKRIVLSAENPQVGHRLEALDRQSGVLASAGAVGKFVGWSAPAFPLRAVAALVLDNCAVEKWEQVLEDYQKLIDEAGDALVPMRPAKSSSSVPPSSVQVRRLVHRRIAALPPSILKRYRQNVDGHAQKLLEEGTNQRSPAPLRRLVDEYFCSRSADLALDLLGDLAFEQGHFEDALAWWRLLALAPGEAASPPPDCLLFPDSTLDSARIRAKEVLAYAFMDQADRARRELAAYRKLHPQARGALAGGEGLYASILEGWIERLAGHGVKSNQEPWTTFAGNPARNRALAVCPPARLWVDGPTWRVRLPAVHPGAAADPPPRTDPAGRLAWHPLVVDSRVLVGDSRSVTGYQLSTGRQLFRFVLKDAGPDDNKAGDGRYTLTAWNKHVFARLGRQSLGPKSGEEKEDFPSTLVCLKLAGSKPGALQWKIAATRPDNSPAFFEGAPLAADGRVFCAVSWVVGLETHTAVVCYDAETGQRRWWQEVCVSPEFEEPLEGRLAEGRPAEPRKRQHLLTLGGGILYYCSQAGAVVALDPWSGQCVWGTRYVSRGPKTEQGFPSPRDLAPCVYADGRLYLAPLDTDRLLCLDATNGRLVWECAGLEVVHLLGVARGRVYCTTARGLECIRADTGERRANGARPGVSSTWMQPLEGRLPGLGRGLLAGSWLLWPTQDPNLPLRGVTLEDGNQERFAIDKTAPREPEYLEPTMLRAILPGNMAFGEDCLVVAGLEELAAYVPQKQFLKEREKNLQDARATPLALYQLAMAQVDAGLTGEAQKSLTRLDDLIRPLARKDGENWEGLSSQRSSELRRSPPWILSLASDTTTDALPDVKTDRPGLLDIPLQKVLEVPAHQMQSVARPFPKYGELVLGRCGEQNFGLDVVADKTLWKHGFINDQPVWLGSFGNIALAAYSWGMAGSSLTDGELLWLELGPWGPRMPYTLRDHEPRRADPFPMTHFRCNCRFIFILVDERLLVAMDPTNGKIAWHSWAPGGQIRPLADGGRFYPHYQAGDRFVLLQTTAGKWLILDSQTGKLLHEGPAAMHWPQPPPALDERWFVLSGTAGQVLLLDADTGLFDWTYQPPGQTSLSGAAAQVFGDKDKLLALVPRNIGPELVRLDPANGKVAWSVPVLADEFDVQTAALDDSAVYFACQNALQARSLRDGRLLWKKKLPGSFSGWQTVRAGLSLLVYPREKFEAPWLPLSAFPFSLPIAYPPFAKPRQERAILVIDPRNGEWLQRLPLADGPGPVTVQVRENCLVVCAGGKMSVFRGSKE